MGIAIYAIVIALFISLIHLDMVMRTVNRNLERYFEEVRDNHEKLFSERDETNVEYPPNKR